MAAGVEPGRDDREDARDLHGFGHQVGRERREEREEDLDRRIVEAAFERDDEPADRQAEGDPPILTSGSAARAIPGENVPETTAATAKR